MTYDNIKSHKKTGFFRKTTGGRGQIDPPAILGLIDLDFGRVSVWMYL